jgi:hypothetical protein
MLFTVLLVDSLFLTSTYVSNARGTKIKIY